MLMKIRAHQIGVKPNAAFIHFGIRIRTYICMHTYITISENELRIPENV